MSTSPLPSAVLSRLPFGEGASLAYRLDGPLAGPKIGASKTGPSPGLAGLPAAIACRKSRAGGMGVVNSDSQAPRGTALDRPPEQLSRERADGRADAYAVGAVDGRVPGGLCEFSRSVLMRCSNRRSREAWKRFVSSTSCLSAERVLPISPLRRASYERCPVWAVAPPEIPGRVGY